MFLIRSKDFRRKVLFLLSAALLSLGSGSNVCGASPRSHGKGARRPVRADSRESRIAHAEELLGSAYRSSPAGRSGTASEAKVRDFVRRETRARLKGRWKRQAGPVADAILLASRERGLDPMLLMAVIANESSFDAGAVGGAGEIGLMQIKPDTGRWIAKTMGLPFRGKSSLRDPVQNIRLGSAYLSFLRERFDFNGRMYLSAYNMGCSKVESLGPRRLACAYPVRVLKHYLVLYGELQSSLRRA